MKMKKISHILFCLIVPFFVVYYIVSQLVEILMKLKNNGNCCEEKDEIKKEITSNTPRQDQIIKYIQKNKIATVPQLLKLFPTVTDRTLRRDLNKMEDSGVVLRSGSTKSVSYTLK
jgi:predicted HTH transcriptional regulator